MAQTGADDDKAKSLEVEFGSGNEKELGSKWATVERLPTFKRTSTTVLFQRSRDETSDKRRVIDVTKPEAVDRHLLIEKLVKQIEADNLHLLGKIRKRIDE